MMRFWIATVSIVCFATAIVHADATEGTTWKINLNSDDSAASPKNFTDSIQFKGGQFISETMKSKGMKSAEYKDDTVRMGPATFTADQTGDGGVKAAWSGTISADQITGQLVWTKKDGSSATYSYTGERTAKN